MGSFWDNFPTQTLGFFIFLDIREVWKSEARGKAANAGRAGSVVRVLGRRVGLAPGQGVGSVVLC